MIKARSGLTELLKELRTDGNNVTLTPGDQWLITSGRLEVGEGTTLNGNGAILYCPENSVRLITNYPGVTIRGITGIGAFTAYNYTGRILYEDCRIAHSLDGKTYLPLGKKGGATAAFMTWLNPSKQKTLEGITFKRCTADHSYHHGFGMSLQGAPEGAGFKRVILEDCRAIASGSGLEGDQVNGVFVPGIRDWSTGFDIPDTGDIDGLTYRRCEAIDSWQSGFHMDGSWSGHRQIQKGILLEDCRAIDSGRRSGTVPGELYQSGYYLQSGKLVRCSSSGARKAGFHLKNGEPNSLQLDSCTSTGDAYGLVIEYGGVGVRVKDFTATANTRRALQATAVAADIGITIRDFRGSGRPVLLGITERLEMVDSTKPGNIRTLETRRKDPKPFNGALTIRAAARDLVAIHPPSRSIVSISRVAYILEDEPTPGTPPIPIPVPQGRIWVEDGWIWVQAPEDQARNVYRLPDELQADPEISTRDGWIWVGSPTKNAGPKYHLPIEVQPHFIEPTIG